MGTDWSPVGQIYWYTLRSTNPTYDLMELKSIEDWTLEKEFKSVPNVVDVSSFGGPTREYQVRIDPEKLDRLRPEHRPGRAAAGRQQHQRRRQLRRAGQQQINIRAVGLFTSIHDIEQTVLKAQNGTPLRVRDIATVAEGPKIRLGQLGKAIHRKDGKIVDDDDVVEGIVLLRKGANSDDTLVGIHEKVKELNDRILPPGVKIVPFLDRSDLVHFTTHTVLHNLTEGFLAGRHHPVPFSRQRARRPYRRAHHSVCAALRLHLSEPARIFPQIFSRSVRWTSAWSWTAPWSWWKTSSAT